jgi:signal transduction histidine kinase
LALALLPALPDDWHAPIALGSALLALAVGIAFPLQIRTQRELRAAERLLEVATGGMADAYATILDANQRLRETAEARDRALFDLRAAVHERETFLDSVAHDLKTPLTVVKGHADLLKAMLARDGTPDKAALVRAVAKIADNAQRMAFLTDELLSLARLGIEETVEIRRHPTDLVAVAKRVVADQSLTTSRHQILLNAPMEHLTGEWDGERIERLVVNLLSNAVKYSPAGGTINLDLTTTDDGATAVLAVRDHGIGIPAADLDRVFERFYRSANVPTTTPGTGLGLASVQHAVDLHGGRIEIESQEGAGTLVTVWLPTAPPASADGEAEPEQTAEAV